MNIQDAYTTWATTYDSDRNRTRDLDQMVTRNTLADLHCRFIVEIGCGTGKNTAFLAQIGEKVLALDFSEGMLQKAKEKLRLDNVALAIADITAPWPCQEQTADLVVCNLVLEHIQSLDVVFAQASRALATGGRFFVCELHPYRQYQGTRAKFHNNGATTEIAATVHHLSDFLKAAQHSGLALATLQEWWHTEDRDQPPRLVSFLFKK